MKTKLIFSKYEESTGVSISVIRCRYGEFTGIARLNPEDRTNASSFVGCEIAERRAVIKALRTQLREVKAMQKAVKMIIEESIFLIDVDEANILQQRSSVTKIASSKIPNRSKASQASIIIFESLVFGRSYLTSSASE